MFPHAQEKTALLFACEKDFLKIAMTLVKHGASIEAKDEVRQSILSFFFLLSFKLITTQSLYTQNGFTPLHISSYKAYETMTLMLLENDANVEALSNVCLFFH